jgi:MYXO-CTERM domain-containing protein
MSTVKSSHFAGYITGTLGAASFLTASQADASVTAVTFGFGSSFSNATYPGFTYFGVFVSGSSKYYGSIAGGTSSSYLTLGGQYTVDGVYHNHSVSSAAGLTSFFTDGTPIGGGGNGGFGTGYFQSSNPLANFSTDQLNKNIGFRTDSGNYGWANVSWDATSKALTVNSAYVESVAGAPIAVGDTGVSAAPEPSRALLALTGLAGVALRRRRRQAA